MPMRNAPEHYLRRIRAHHPEAALAEAELVTDGFNNEVVVVDGELVCRFPKHPWGGEALLHEARALELARRHVAMPLPRYERLAPDFASYRRIPGEPLTHLHLERLPPARRAAAIDEIGAYLRDLHAIAPAEAEGAGVGLSAVARAPEAWLELYDEVREHLFPRVRPHQRYVIEQRFAPVLAGELELACEPAVIDGDLAVYHLLHDPESGVMTGKIDLGTAGLGDPAYDLATLIRSYGEPVVRAMGRVYPGLERHLARARFFAATFELQWALGGLMDGNSFLAFAHLGGVGGPSSGARSVTPPAAPSP